MDPGSAQAHDAEAHPCLTSSPLLDSNHKPPSTLADDFPCVRQLEVQWQSALARAHSSHVLRGRSQFTL